jgi:hypothetical protein
MGKPILYCGDCGRSLREDDFDRRKAGLVQNLPYCLECRPDAILADAKPVATSSARVRPLPSSTPARSLPASRATKTPWAVAAAVGGAVLLVALVGALSTSPPKPAPPPAPRPAPAVVARPPESEPEPAARPRPAPPRPLQPETAPPPENPAVVLDRYLGDIQAIRASDAGFKRADEVRAMLRHADGIAGPRKAEVDALLAGYEKEIARVPAPVPAQAAPKPPPPTGKIAGFTLINADTEKPVAGYDPVAPDTAIDMGKLGLKKLDFRINTAPAYVGPVETIIDSAKARTESGNPYSFTNNSQADGFTGWTPGPGRHTLKARVGKGEWVTFSFTIVDPR